MNVQTGPCNVCVIGYDGDPADFYRESKVKARKPHTCSECRCEIVRGEQYIRYSGKYDGGMFGGKVCVLCLEIAKKFSCDGSWEFGVIWSSIRDELFPQLTTGCLEGLSAKAKEKVRDEYRKWLGMK